MNLDAAIGKPRWYYQGVTNDFMDHDMQTSLIAATTTGNLIWKTPVGEHSVSDGY